MYYIYFIYQVGNIQCVKIGMTKDLIKRLKDLQTGNPNQLKYYKYFPISSCKSTCYRMEKFLHLKYHEVCIRKEWFYLSLNKLENICININKFLQNEIKFSEI